ncbi:DUF6157 family protein [Gorillibacterium sp. sgz5001074]|uniref:DUF6157 family protein n=1 Tax=Gorillibacterium sp. sgz5001074 TaxID=3446695 RepID=UPI003F666ED3
MPLIRNSFVLVSPDCPVEHSVEPVVKKDAKPSVHALQYELLSSKPYRYTLDDLIYEVHIRHKEIPAELVEAEGERIREELLSKSHPCMRASMLPKKYGWGVHYDEEGKLALVAMESPEYQTFAEGKDGGGVKVEPAMRNKRK